MTSFLLLHDGSVIYAHAGSDTSPIGDVPIDSILGLCSSFAMLTSLRLSSTPEEGHSNKNNNNNNTGRLETKGLNSQAKINGESEQGKDMITTIALQGVRYMNTVLGPFTLLLKGPISESEAYMSGIMNDVIELLTYYLGQFVLNPSNPTGGDVDEQRSHMMGVLGYLDSLLDRYGKDARVLVRGSPWIYMDEDTRLQLDRMMSSLEEQESITGSALVMGSSIVHSRLSGYDNRMLLHSLTTQKMTSSKMRVIPVFVDQAWKHLVTYKLRNMVLCVTSHIQASISNLTSILEDFEETMDETSLQVPIEEPPVLLRHYTGHNTVAFAYHHRRTGLCVTPATRPGPEYEKAHALSRFAWFFGRAQHAMASENRSEVVLHLKNYRFYAKSNQDADLYILFSASVEYEDMNKLSAEIIRNVKRHNVGVLV